jgi:hypothetical protein
MSNEHPKFRLPGLERRAVEHRQRILSEEQSGVLEKASKDETLQRHLQEHEFLRNSNSAKVFKKAALLLNEAGVDSYLTLTDRNEVVERSVKPEITLAWGVYEDRTPGIGSDSYETSLYFFNKIGCKVTGAPEVIIIEGRGEVPVRDSSLGMLAETIDNAVNHSVLVNSSHQHPANLGTIL